MIIRGTVEKGRVVILDSGSTLPIGTRVDVSVRKSTNKKSLRKGAPDPLSRIGDFAVRAGTRTFSDDHNLLAYGPGPASKPKRKRRGAK